MLVPFIAKNDIQEKEPSNLTTGSLDTLFLKEQV